MELKDIQYQTINDVQYNVYENEVKSIDQSSEDLEQLQPQEHQFEEANGESLLFLLKRNNQIKTSSSKSTIQPKLTIGQPNDQYEQEADRMADLVVNQISSGQLNVKRKPKKPIIQQKKSDSQHTIMAPSFIAQKLKQKKGQGSTLQLLRSQPYSFFRNALASMA